jgi:glycosyltransferase involved in cell wall biosynthesis
MLSLDAHTMTATISIVMPVLNRAAFIGRAIASVLDQKATEVEIIVIDGGSTDRTRDVVRIFSDVRLIEAPGSSIWEAVNIGIRHATGSLIGHLNSDDRLSPGALHEIRRAAAAAPAAAIIRGRVKFVVADETGGFRSLPVIDANVAESLDLRAVTGGHTAVNACFVRDETYHRLGCYDESLRIAGDREWLLRAVLAETIIHQVDQPVYEYLVHDSSLTTRRTLPGESVYLRYIHEHLAIAECYLAKTTGRNRRLLRAWHAQETLRLISCGWSTPGLATQIARAFEVSPVWPLWSVDPLVNFAIRRFRRRITQVTNPTR